jgi:hypothetical protein
LPLNKKIKPCIGGSSALRATRTTSLDGKKYLFVILLETLPHLFSFGVVRVKGDGEVYR